MILHRFETGMASAAMSRRPSVVSPGSVSLRMYASSILPRSSDGWSRLCSAPLIPSARTSLAFSASPLARRAMLELREQSASELSAWEERRRALEQVDRWACLLA